MRFVILRAGPFPARRIYAVVRRVYYAAPPWTPAGAFTSTALVEHKYDAGSAFTSRYHIDRLVWFETHHDVRAAIARETQIKGWTRAKKKALVVAQNPAWRDLSEDWGSPAVVRFAGDA